MNKEELVLKLREVKEEIESLENDLDRQIYNREYRSELNDKLISFTEQKIRLEKMIDEYSDS